MMEIIIKCSDDVRGGTNIYGEPIQELVRCEECRHWRSGVCLGIPFNGDDASYIETEADDYCSYGERKGECKECWHWSEVHKRCENKCGCQFKPYGEREGE